MNYFIKLFIVIADLTTFRKFRTTFPTTWLSEGRQNNVLIVFVKISNKLRRLQFTEGDPKIFFFTRKSQLNQNQTCQKTTFNNRTKCQQTKSDQRIYHAYLETWKKHFFQWRNSFKGHFRDAFSSISKRVLVHILSYKYKRKYTSFIFARSLSSKSNSIPRERLCNMIRFLNRG